MKYYFNVAVANGINKLGWTPDVPDEHLGMSFSPTCHEVITICEEIEKLVETWPVVYGTKIDSTGWILNETKDECDAHTARLAFIEELPKQECKHEPQLYRTASGYEMRDYNGDICKHCGIEMVAEWKVK